LPFMSVQLTILLVFRLGKGMRLARKGTS
jgi:hypothetical protein